MNDVDRYSNVVGKQGMHDMYIDNSDSFTSEDSALRDSESQHQKSIATEIYANACKIIPGLENPGQIKPDPRKRFTCEYDDAFSHYSAVNQLHNLFVDAIKGDVESKDLLVLWLLQDMKSIDKKFYDKYRQYNKEDSNILKAQITQLLHEYIDVWDPDLDLKPAFILGNIDDDVKQWYMM